LGDVRTLGHGLTRSKLVGKDGQNQLRSLHQSVQ
jgi:hypothetical protein